MGFVRDAFHNLRKRPSLVLIGFLSIFFTQLIVNIFIFGYLEMEKMGKFSGQSFTIKAYFQSEVTDEKAQETVQKLKNLPDVSSIVFLSKEDAQKKFLEYFELTPEDFPVDENPFPLSVEIIPKRVESIPELANQVKNTGLFDDVIYGGKNVDVFVKFYHMLLSVGSIVPVSYTHLDVYKRQVVGGGSLLQDSTSFRSLIYYSFLLWWAQIFHRPLIFYRCGLGPFHKVLSQKLRCV